jgi:HEAT repeat protein
MLTSSQLELRLSALSILRATYDLPGSRAHRPQVEELLISDPDPKVRILAAETLARRRRKQEVILLGDVMKEDDHPKVQRAAADLLTEFRSPLAYPDLIAVLKNISSPPIVVESALNALGKLRARAALDQLRFFSKDPKPELRIAAAVALAQCGDIAAAVPIFREEFAQVHYLSRHMQILQGIAGLKRAQGRALLKKFAEEPVHPLLAITEHPNLWLSATALRVLDAFQRGWDADLLQLWEQIK